MNYKEKFKQVIASPEKISTPSYFYSEEILKENIRKIKEIFGKKIELCYSIKANPFLVSFLSEEINIFEVCSYGEYQICKEQLCMKNEIIFGGVCKFDYEISDAIDDSRVVLTSESINQLKKINKLCAEKNKIARVLLRLSAGNQFGMSEKEIYEIVKNYRSYANIKIVGIQYYEGTQTFKISDEIKRINYLFDFVSYIEKEFSIKIEIVDFGAGIGIPYYKIDYERCNLEEMYRAISKLLSERCGNHRVICELGRAIAAECGIYVSRVIDQKENAGRMYSILDGGTNHIKYYGHAYGGRNVVIDILNDSLEKNYYTVCGPLCTVSDVLINNEKIKKHKIGDVVIFPNAGAYCQTEANALFLSRDFPAISIIKENGIIVKLRDKECTYKING